MRKLTHSQIERFRTCPRRYYYEYVLGLRPAVAATALRHGTLQHEALALLESDGLDAALEHIRLKRPEWTGPDRFVPYTVAATTRAYAQVDHGPVRITDILAVEPVFTMPLISPDGVRSRTWMMAGRIDYIVRIDGDRIAVREVKTVDNTPDERYFLRLMMDPQISLYLSAARWNWRNLSIDTVVYDVLRKPSISPYLATPQEARRYTKDGRLYASQRETDELPEEWEERLLADILSRPDFYFARREVPRLLAELDVFAAECWNWARMIREAELEQRWVRNVTRNCEWCPHFNHCCGVVDLEQTPVPDGFVRVDNVHPELEETE